MKIAIFGSSGFSRETADICYDIGYTDVVLVDFCVKESLCFGIPVVDERKISTLIDKQYHFIIGIGDNQVRKKVYLKFPSLNYVNLIHPSASFGREQLAKFDNRIGNIVTAGVRFTNNIEIGNFGIYNLNATVGHDSIIEDFINLAPGANVSGNVSLSEGAYIGTNAVVLQGKSIEEKLSVGKNSTVGAGAVVVKSLSDNITVKGIPAK